MARNDANDSLISALLDPSPLPERQYGLKGRYRRSKSAPGDFILHERNHDLLPSTDSISASYYPHFKQVAFFLAVYFGVGAICFSLMKDQFRGQKTNGVLDAFYFCVLTMTTVGYGEIIPNSVSTKLLACAFVFTGRLYVGQVIRMSADYLVEKQQMMLVKCLNLHQKDGASEVLKGIKTKSVKYKFIVNLTIVVLLMVIGTTFLYKVENLEFIDAFYCVCSVVTTLGYGDNSFSTQVGRIFAVFWILTSTTCMALFSLYLAELVTERRQGLLVKKVLMREMTRVDLEAADLDNDGVVSAAEFVLYKLKEMGKINQEDITLVTKVFDDLDDGQSGRLTVGQSSHAYC